jgi:hypothetical protein
MTTPTTATYVALATSQYQTKQKFLNVIALYTSWSADVQRLYATIPTLFDLDVAVGVQLDDLGQRVGFARYIFVAGLGTVTLNDADYRTLLRAKILANHWDGHNDTLQVILASLFPGTGITLFAIDNQDMSMDIFVTGGTLTPTQLALITSGLLVPKPEGVLLAGVAVITGPLFGLDFEDTGIAGLDVGAFFSFS